MKLEVSTVKEAASSQWVTLLASVGGIPAEFLSGKPTSCPKCGGKDRFRLIDEQAGSILCNQCFRERNGDGFSAIQWALGVDFRTAVKLVAEACGLLPPSGSARGKVSAKPTAKTVAAPSATKEKPRANPLANLEFAPWNDYYVSLWLRKKRPITADALKAVGARLGTYRKKYPVIALPIYGEQGTAAEPVGWALFSADGKTLPAFFKSAGSEKIEVQQVKSKLTSGSQAGWIGSVDRLAEATHVWKVEGLSDLLTLLSQELPAGHVAITNAFGSKEDPSKNEWLLKSLAGKTVYVVHDADVPGQEGALGVSRRDKTLRPGWVQQIAKHAGECRNVTLPYDVEKDHGKDLRDWFLEGSTITGLLTLAEQASSSSPDSLASDVKEADDDPHRLARINLKKLRDQGKGLCYWRSEWYVWKKNRYVRITPRELKAKLNLSIKQELDDCYRAAYQQWKDEGREGKPPVARQVSRPLVNNVLDATAGLAVVSGGIENQTWLPDRSARKYISLENGLLDVDALLSDSDNYLLPHSPNWFSTVAMPYDFVPGAECPKWLAFLSKSLEGDTERINLLQEWAGYLLLPDTSFQRFLLLEGSGANGKSVYLAGMTALLGKSNVSNVPFEFFGGQFARTQTLHKLANISGDCDEIEKVAEGLLKTFTSGDRVTFDRKGIEGIEVDPTARLMLSCNVRPRFRDRTDGIWRRMLLVPWRIQIPERERILNMDKVDYWTHSGELPGILWWALQGLERLRRQGFTRSAIAEDAKAAYRTESSSAREFCKEFIVATDEDSWVRTDVLYDYYSRWCRVSNYKPFGSVTFSKELTAVFPKSKRTQTRVDGRRAWGYEGIYLSDLHLPGVDVTSDEMIAGGGLF